MEPTPHSLRLSKVDSTGRKEVIEHLASAPTVHHVPFSLYSCLAFRQPTAWTLLMIRFESHNLAQAAIRDLSHFKAI